MSFTMRLLIQRVAGALLLAAISSEAVAADFYAPPSGSGPAVVLISGASGTQAYRWYAMDVAKLGYTVVVVPGRQICAAQASGCAADEQASADNLKKTIAEAQSDKRVQRGKVAVIGFSLGGGGALVYAAPLADAVAGVVAYYPSISKVPDVRAVAARVATPTLVLAGERDKYFNCCLIESMRAFESGARGAAGATELVVYPEADHAFNLEGQRYRPEDAQDAWERTKQFLARVHPIK